MAATADNSRTFVMSEMGTHGAASGFASCRAARKARHPDGFHQEQPMRKYMLTTAAVVALAIATPAAAYDSGGFNSMQMALQVAADIGLVTVSHTQFAGDEWQIQGRDISGRYMEVDVDTTTGAVLNVDR
jgi:hypothetical protein